MYDIVNDNKTASKSMYTFFESRYANNSMESINSKESFSLEMNDFFMIIGIFTNFTSS